MAVDSHSTLTELRGRACAKINLTLAVGPARPDGFHGLESLVAQISLADDVTVRLAAPGSLSITCDQAGIPCDGTNLAVRAARALAGDRISNLGAHITLTKRIPAGAGLGGGSSNAATTLQLLNELWRLGRSQTDLSGIGATVGSDVPLFFGGPLCIMRGRGESVTPVRATLVGCVLLAIPPVHSSTAAVYSAFDALSPAPARPPGSRRLAQGCEAPATTARLSAEGMVASVARPSASFAAGPPQIYAPHLMPLVFNDLEPAALAVSDDLRLAGQRIREASGLPFCMSGSGSAFFCLLDKYEDRRRLAMWREKVESAVPRTRVDICYCPP